MIITCCFNHKELKLQKTYSYKYKDIPRYKYIISIPEKIINEIGWEPGSELKIKKSGQNLVINYKSKPLRKTKDPAPSMSFEEFQEKIVSLLKSKQGLTWSQVRKILSLPQKVPNNKWVTRLEKEIGLVRLKDKNGIIWQLENRR